MILLYLAVQLLENTLLVPRIQGDSLNLHPAAIILTIVVASHYFGLWGVIIGPPLVALFKEMFVWFVREWNRPPEAPGTWTAMKRRSAEPAGAGGRLISLVS